MDPKKQELVESLSSANNILVTVSSNPSVDQLAACIGLTLLLNKLKKHATAVFSGQVPSTLEFLKPDETIEKTTDSLRDFIISLDKSKADKLRYKVEENVVKIFITPYRTSIGEPDLNFSQGDFNVDVVLCLGISKQQDVDQAITSHGRILHDAVVASINTTAGGELGTVNWTDTNASSLSELAANLADELGENLIDSQIATAFLTGIVAETDRFSNEKTSPNTMKLSAELMSSGANQQLVATALQSDPMAPLPDAGSPADTPLPPAPSTDGTMEIGHAESDDTSAQLPQTPLPESELADVDDVPKEPETLPNPGAEPDHVPASRIMLQPPSLGGSLTANSKPEEFDPSIDPLTMLNTDEPILSHYSQHTDVTSPPQLPDDNAPAVVPPPTVPETTEVIAPELSPLELPKVVPPAPEEISTTPTPSEQDDKLSASFEPLPTEPPTSALQQSDDNQIQIDAQGNLLPSTPLGAPVQKADDPPQVLADLERAVDSPHLAVTAPADDASVATPDADSARDALAAIYNSDPTPPRPEPKAASGSSGYLQVQDLPDIADPDEELPSYMPSPSSSGTVSNEPAPNASSPADQPLNMPLPPSMSLPPADPTPPTSTTTDPSSPPPVPPPFNPLP